MEEGKEQPQDLKSEHITLTVDHEPECVVRYVVKVDAALTKKTREMAIQSLAKEVSLPGFRKGRAPNHLIVKHFADLLDKRWQKHLADTTFEACYALTHISPLKPPISFHVKRHSVTDGSEMTFTFERDPEVPDIDMDALAIREVKRDVVDEAAYTVALDDLRSFFGNWEKISGRNVQVGDHVLVDIDIIEKDPPERALSNARLEVDESKMAKWMFDITLGMEIGESREGISQVDRDAPEEEKAKTPPRRVSLTLRGIEKFHLPDIEDALAKKVGLKDMEELKEHLMTMLNKRANMKQHEEYRKQICDHLDAYPFDLPRSLFSEEKRARMNLLGSAPGPRTQPLENLDMDVQKSLRYFFISRKIVAKYGIDVSTNESHKRSTPLQQIFGEAPGTCAEKDKSEKDCSTAMTALIFEKATDYLISRARILPEPTAQQAIQEEETDIKLEKENPPEESDG